MLRDVAEQVAGGDWSHDFYAHPFGTQRVVMRAWSMPSSWFDLANGESTTDCRELGLGDTIQ